MIDFVNRQPTQANRFKLSGDVTGYVVVERADEPTVEGTPLSRKYFMAVQDFIGIDTVFNSDGSITETNTDGDTKTTVFNADGSITETFIGATSGYVIQKSTIFNTDGSITSALNTQEGW